MPQRFGTRVRKLREEKGITREEFCGDESELSVRQLARIEMGKSLPRISTVFFIADVLEVKVGQLTDGEEMALPKRYQELKYSILRTPVYMDPKRVSEREAQFDEISECFYEELPEDEKLTIDCLQAVLDTFSTKSIDFSKGLLEEYLEQIKIKKQYGMNDLILLHLYLSGLKWNEIGGVEKEFVLSLLNKLFLNYNQYTVEELFMLNVLLVNLCSIYLIEKSKKEIEFVLEKTKEIMNKIQDFNKMPIISLLEWKYSLTCLDDAVRAKKCYKKADMFAGMMGDIYLQKQLKEEWEKDSREI
ncbi:helix-turn-helix domain-containing protein [Streptococcus ovis]|uniref:helix-turn-helix domain-containing protein n=1 Tax=Streptococcus ovis TaxID=82806 RepID=UPI00037C0BFE|nr:XRE family transcriptional regulator [Streptococcus ovis]